MKQKFRILLCTLCVLAAVGMAVPPVHSAAVQLLTVPDSGITLDTPELTLELTQEAPAPVAYLCVYAPNDYFFVIWSSSDSRVASVDGTGKVTGHAEGKATITACTERGEKASCEVTVSRGTASPPVLNETQMELTITADTPAPSRQLKLTGGKGALARVSQWVSSAPAVAQVSPDGTVTAVSDGETTIMAVSEQGRCGVCYVSVGAAAWRYRSEEELTEVLTLSGQLPYSDGK